jgi:hypothetical protein
MWIEAAPGLPSCADDALKADARYDAACFPAPDGRDDIFVTPACADTPGALITKM